jgi:uncharacterized repeat protein (TIGR02543 family)
MPKTFLKKSAGWTEMKSIFIKKTTGWAEIRKVFLKKASGWVLVFQKLSLPDTTTSPSIRKTNTSGTGGTYDGPVATSPQYLNENLYGKDGVYTNYTSIFGRKFTSGSTAEELNRSTVVTGDLFTSGGGVTNTMRSNLDGKYLFYELTVQNGSSSNEIYPISSAIKMIKSAPTIVDFQWTQAEEVGTQLALNYVYENYYYNSIDPDLSYIKWWRNTTDSPGGTLIKSETITATTTGTPSSTSRSGTSYYTPTSSDIGFYIVAETTAVNSYTTHYGYTNYSVASFPTVLINGPLTFSNIQVKDYYDNKGLDNRDRWPTGTLNKYTGQLSGYDSNTILRIRYRIYNYDTGLYWKPSTGTQTTSSAAWDSYYSDGSGDGYISSVSVSNGVATFYDYFNLDQSVFNGGGSGPTWWLEIELSASRGIGRTYYINPYETYYISKRIDPTISRSPSGTVAPNTDVTFSGTFAGYPATPSTNAYPRQYRIVYGDGTNSGWLPIGEYAYGSLNPTYSITKQYSAAGTYTAEIQAIPHGSFASTSVTVASLKTPPTIDSIVPSNTGGNVSVYFSGGSGPYYQIYWYGTNTAPTYSVTPDGSGSSSPVSDSTGPTSTATQYMYIRSVATAGETSVGPSTLASAWSAGVPFNMTTPPPSGGTVSISTNTGNYSVGSVITYSTSGWTPTPTSYSLRLHNGTNPVLQSDPQRASTTSTSGTYTIAPEDVPKFFKAWVTVSNSGGSADAFSTQVGPAYTPVAQYSVTWNANGGTGGTTTGPYDAGTSHTAPAVSRSGYTFNGWYTASSGGSYVTGAQGSYTPTSTITLWAQWTAAFTPPTCVAPSLQFSRKTTSPTHLQWYCDYPTPSGDWSTIQGMQFEIRTTAGGGTLLASGTRSFPGFGSYPYSAGGTIWAFRMGTSDGDITYSSSARYGRARVVMTGTNGSTYYGTWSGWL